MQCSHQLIIRLASDDHVISSLRTSLILTRSLHVTCSEFNWSHKISSLSHFSSHLFFLRHSLTHLSSSRWSFPHLRWELSFFLIISQFCLALLCLLNDRSRVYERKDHQSYREDQLSNSRFSTNESQIRWSDIRWHQELCFRRNQE
jgi:hypothetical protein